MFKRIRQLRISLAAKCQILFGAAVVLIISSALAVPWQRMEQLTEQLNVGAARALADNAVAGHIALHSAGLTDVPAWGLSPATLPTTQPAGTGGDPSAPPHLLSLAPRRAATNEAKFERRAIAHFARNPASLYYSSYYDRPDGSRGYRYAQPLYLNPETCLGCHTTAAQARLRPPPTRPATVPVAVPETLPATAPAPSATSPGPSRPVMLEIDPESRDVGWVGIVSVEFGSRIDTTQRLLNRAFILMAGLLGGVLAFFTFYFITTRLILQPVRVLQETAEKVSEGDLNIRSDISTGDEFQQLSETFNEMLANLKENADALRAVNKSLDLRLGQLAETNVGLYESNRIKSEFLANVSHELRTPLNSILGFADLLKDALAPVPAPTPAVAPDSKDVKDVKDAKAIRYVHNIRQSGRNLLELINDLLDLAKIEAGRMEIRSEPLSLSDLFEGLVTILKPLVEPKRVAIEASVGPDVPILHSDPNKLQQVLYNLLSNAIKFSPEEGVITLAAERISAPPPGIPGAAGGENGGHGGGPISSPISGHVRIVVADHGPGIDPAKHAVIFEKFRQLDGSVTRTHSGTGLGLAISKELTALLGGSIGVDSSPGEGAVFWLVLPLDVPAGQVDVRSRMALT